MTDDQTNDFDELSDDQLEAAAGGAGEGFGDSANDDQLHDIPPGVSSSVSTLGP